jgi:hypothetical protein
MDQSNVRFVEERLIEAPVLMGEEFWSHGVGGNRKNA